MTGEPLYPDLQSVGDEEMTSASTMSKKRSRNTEEGGGVNVAQDQTLHSSSGKKSQRKTMEAKQTSTAAAASKRKHEDEDDGDHDCKKKARGEADYALLSCFERLHFTGDDTETNTHQMITSESSLHQNWFPDVLR